MGILDDLQAPFGTSAIEQLIPHRYPFLLLDRVLEFSVMKRIVGIKNVSATDAYLQGHFPGNPVMPGVLIVEGLAQTAGVLGRISTPDRSELFLLTEVSKARFRRPVVPGDVLRFEVDLMKWRAPFFWFDGEALVDGQSVSSVSLSARLT